MNQLVPFEQLSPAQKAWVTRRQNGWVPTSRSQKSTSPTHSPAHNPRALSAKALEAFEREAQSDAPDWHAAALALKQALTSRRGGPATHLRIEGGRPLTERPRALPAPIWPDYPIEGRPRTLGPQMQWPSPMLVVTFADGEVVRAPAVSLQSKPVNIGRGLRIAIAFYQSRICRRLGLKNRPGTRPAIPEITSCVCEHTGHVYDPAECTARTVNDRAAQDWKIRRKI